jgi:hypothetical protein
VVDDAPPGPISQRLGVTGHHRTGQGCDHGRFNLDAVEAFELLSRLSQDSDTKLIEIARSLIDTEHPLKRRHRAERRA